MRSNVALWWLLFGFFFVIGVVYTGWNAILHWPMHAAPGQHWWVTFTMSTEWVGTVALFFTAGMAALVGFYLAKVHKAQGGELPEDILTSEIDDGDPEVGEFSPWSWWPIVLAGSASVFMIGLAVGHFLLPVGLALFVIAIVGWVYEYYRGHFAR